MRIVVGQDDAGWHERFMSTLEARAIRDPRISFRSASLDGHDWIDQVDAAEMVIWNPVKMGPIAASHFKEKVYHLEHVMGKRVVPNYATVWHFESKVAQSYLLRSHGVPQPRTWVSFDRDDAMIAAAQLGLPLVSKESHGAGSENVHLLNRASQVRRFIERHLGHQRWREVAKNGGFQVGGAVDVGLPPVVLVRGHAPTTGPRAHGCGLPPVVCPREPARPPSDRDRTQRLRLLARQSPR